MEKQQWLPVAIRLVEHFDAVERNRIGLHEGAF
jgi:hypothetical protein